ncbi:HlyD family efflux transporter periplasmic adaptor subunit [Ottowia sp. GY511]|uniref:HlyD family secretion protein n=1 Tax=Ottowia sp. GY511 TaxID=2603274 RepID=UPI0011CA9634|nr:HlyD family efflux transporter periplasmic adaptor subunit [Ottowia sp. GY511]TXK32825.1 HlyD family efflux transporter periplasmic adaptor subunit [Ottowia sp. GY511]
MTRRDRTAQARPRTGRSANRRRLAGVLLAATAVLAACTEPVGDGWSGYAEGDYVYVAAPVAGRLTRLAVRAGDDVAQGAPLFALDEAPERDALQAAEAQRDAAVAQSANLQTGKRPDEVAQVQAQLAQARAQATLARTDSARKASLVTQAAVSRSEADAARTAAAAADQRVTELEAALRTARQPARAQERAAAEAQARAADGALAQQRWRLDQMAQAAPASGQVADTLFREGEWVAAGQPVVSLLPPGHLKARFFVPEAALSQLKSGVAVQLNCDGCAAPLTARISRIATEPEYTPPVIYSNAQRAKLVFMVEALPETQDVARLKPGQPLDVRLLPAVPGS